MSNTNQTPLLDLLMASDFGSANPARVRELLDRAIEVRTGGKIIENDEPVRGDRELVAAA